MCRHEICIMKWFILDKWQILKICVCSRYLALICTHACRPHYLPLSYLASKVSRRSSASGNLKDLKMVLQVSEGNNPDLHIRKRGVEIYIRYFPDFLQVKVSVNRKTGEEYQDRVKKPKFYEMLLLQSWETWRSHCNLSHTEILSDYLWFFMCNIREQEGQMNHIKNQNPFLFSPLYHYFSSLILNSVFCPWTGIWCHRMFSTPSRTKSPHTKCKIDKKAVLSLSTVKCWERLNSTHNILCPQYTICSATNRK